MNSEGRPTGRLRSSRAGASFDESRNRECSAQPWSDSAQLYHVVACVWEILAAFRPDHARRPKTKRLVDVSALCSLCVPDCFPDAMWRLRRPTQETRGSLSYRDARGGLRHSTATTCEAWWSIRLVFVVPGNRSEGITDSRVAGIVGLQRRRRMLCCWIRSDRQHGYASCQFEISRGARQRLAGAAVIRVVRHAGECTHVFDAQDDVGHAHIPELSLRDPTATW